jgi:hypothetical protein
MRRKNYVPRAQTVVWARFGRHLEVVGMWHYRCRCRAHACCRCRCDRRRGWCGAVVETKNIQTFFEQRKEVELA